jgi:hypothetical protein
MADEYMQSIATAGQPNDLGLEQTLVPFPRPRKWASLDPTIVLPRIDELASDPNKIRQGVLGLCGPAAFYHHIVQKNPAGFSSFAKDLYGKTEAFIGNLKVRPRQSLLDADYAALVKQWPTMPPQADWMLLASIRDSENWMFAFTGAPDEFAITTWANWLSNWYTECGFYSGVSYSNDKSPAAIQAINKTPNNHIALAIDVALINPGDTGGHMITLESPITINPAADTASFDYWTWGRPVRTLNTTWTNLQKYYRSRIVATF